MFQIVCFLYLLRYTEFSQFILNNGQVTLAFRRIADLLSMTVTRITFNKYTATCRCGKEMRVRSKHFGRMCRCTKCGYPIYVTYDSVSPPVHPRDQASLRYFTEDDAPLEWQRGDLISELYEVRELIGSGGMGVVYRVFHRGWTKTIAVKSPKPKSTPGRGWIRMFELECETWMNLPSHLNTVECYYFRRFGDIPRVFVEFVPGSDLHQFIYSKDLYEGDRGEILHRMLDIAIQTAWGLQHAHQHGVIHRDVKPSNLLIRKDSTVKVTDFGLAHVFDSGVRTRNNNTPRKVTGTPVYRSPDHMSNREITYRSDIWCWAVTVLQMFAGEVFWNDGCEAGEALDSLLDHGSRFELIPIMPGGLQTLLRQCLQLDPDDRPGTMLDIANSVQEIYSAARGKPYDRPAPQPEGDTDNVLNNRAVSLLDIDKPKQSEVLWRRITNSNSHHLPTLFNVRLHLWRNGRLTDAEILEALFAAERDHPGDWQPQYLAARILIERGDCAAAIELLEDLFCVHKDVRDIAFTLAMAQNLVTQDKRLVWNHQTGSPICTAVCLSKDGWRGLTGGIDGRLRRWEISTSHNDFDIAAHEGRIFSIALSHNERFIMTGGADGLAKLWDASTGHWLHTLSGHTDVVRSVALSTDGSLALSAGRDGTLRLWATETGECIGVIRAHPTSISAVSLSGDGAFALSASRDKTLKYWDLRTGICLRTLEGNNAPVTDACLSADRKLAYSISGRKFKVWDLETGVVLKNIRAHEHQAHSLSVNEDGGYAVTATMRGTMKIWDIATGQCLRSLQSFAPTALSHDGRYAMSGSPTGDFQVWSVHCGVKPFQAPYLIAREEGPQHSSTEDSF